MFPGATRLWLAQPACSPRARRRLISYRPVTRIGPDDDEAGERARRYPPIAQRDRSTTQPPTATKAPCTSPASGLRMKSRHPSASHVSADDGSTCRTGSGASLAVAFGVHRSGLSRARSAGPRRERPRAALARRRQLVEHQRAQHERADRERRRRWAPRRRRARPTAGRAALRAVPAAPPRSPIDAAQRSPAACRAGPAGRIRAPPAV